MVILFMVSHSSLPCSCPLNLFVHHYAVVRHSMTYNEAVSDDIQKIIIKTTQKMINCEIGQFRLMVLVHLAAQIGFILKPKKLLNNLSYPAPGRCSYNILKENNFFVHNFEVVS